MNSWRIASNSMPLLLIEYASNVAAMLESAVKLLGCVFGA